MATLSMMPCPISFLILNALYKGFQMRYHLFLKSFEKVVKIAPTRSFWRTLYGGNSQKNGWAVYSKSLENWWGSYPTCPIISASPALILTMCNFCSKLTYHLSFHYGYHFIFLAKSWPCRWQKKGIRSFHMLFCWFFAITLLLLIFYNDIKHMCARVVHRIAFYFTFRVFKGTMYEMCH